MLLTNLSLYLIMILLFTFNKIAHSCIVLGKTRKLYLVMQIVPVFLQSFSYESFYFQRAESMAWPKVIVGHDSIFVAPSL